MRESSPAARSSASRTCGRGRPSTQRQSSHSAKSCPRTDASICSSIDGGGSETDPTIENLGSGTRYGTVEEACTGPGRLSSRSHEPGNRKDRDRRRHRQLEHGRGRDRGGQGLPAIRFRRGAGDRGRQRVPARAARSWKRAVRGRLPGRSCCRRRTSATGRAANLALGDGTAELVCVSNADVLPEPSTGDARRGRPRGGASRDGRPCLWRQDRPLPLAAAHRMTMLGRIFAGTFSRGPVPPPAPDEVKAVGQPSGACFVMQRETWELCRASTMASSSGTRTSTWPSGCTTRATATSWLDRHGSGTPARAPSSRSIARSCERCDSTRWSDTSTSTIRDSRPSTHCCFVSRQNLRATAPMKPRPRPGAPGD